MTFIERSPRSCFARTIILVGVVACLCFSVGEGLRLRPFPVAALAECETVNTELDSKSSHKTSLRKYGPLDVPTRAQKRGKRLVVDFGNPPSQSIRELATHQLLLVSEDEALNIGSPLLGALSTGRAPPFIS